MSPTSLRIVIDSDSEHEGEPADAEEQNWAMGSDVSIDFETERKSCTLGILFLQFHRSLARIS